MNLKHALAGLLLAGFVTPVLADYWVVQDPTTKKCTVTKEKPPETTTATVVINKGEALQTEEEANDYIKRTTDCNRN
ncbi:MAG: hypothetical protein JO216_13910 [Hyphomicrobiales bacterium]|nr:hypothetical protein [Hyphomicrobiales bacterium]